MTHNEETTMTTHDGQFPHTDIPTKAPAARGGNGRNRSRAWLLALCLGACLGAVACVGEGDSDDTETDLGSEVESQTSAVIMDERPTAAAGPCTVTAGPSAGMKGYYDSDGWCCSPRLSKCVECGETAKCKSTVKATLTSANATVAR
jgi:hypothetical protein